MYLLFMARKKKLLRFGCIVTTRYLQQYIMKDMTISAYPEQAPTYSDFQPLIPTKRMNIKDAFKECGILRLQKRKADQQ
jgi:hypothetical protein